MIVNHKIFQYWYFLFSVLTYFNYYSWFGGQTNYHYLFMEFKCNIERQVIIEGQPKIWVGWGKVAVLDFLVILMLEIKQALPYWKQRALVL